MDETTPLLLQNQSHALSKRRLLAVFPALALIQFTSFLDQTAISTSLPAIASALDTGASISLVGASFLITSTSIQLINGRLSDIFGRKAALVTALSIMGAGNLWSGFCGTRIQLFVSRACTGLGAGAINALVQIAIADITTLRQRGYYFGMVGLAVAFGNGLGPVVGGVLTQSFGWRWAFWFVCPLCIIAIVYLSSVWPDVQIGPRDAKTHGNLKMVDWPGALASLAGISMMLASATSHSELPSTNSNKLQVPISLGGSILPWGSPITIGMLLSGAVFIGLFLTIEWRFAKLPLLPAQLFRYGASTNILICSNIIIGWIYWGNLFLLPLYLQNVRGASPARAGTLLLPMVVAHGLTSALTGIIISTTGHYKPVIVCGAFCWVAAAVGKMLFAQNFEVWKIAVVGVLDGIGVGCSLQPVLVGLLAGSDAENRAVVTGLRNFVRDLGGATGTTVSGTILSNLLVAKLQHRFSHELIARLTSSAFALKDWNLTASDKDMISRAYMDSLTVVYMTFGGLAIIHLCLCLCIKDYGLKQSNSRKPQQRTV